MPKPLYWAIQLLCAVFILRLHFELSTIDPYLRPIYRLRKLTDPLVLPLRKQLPRSLRAFAALIVGLLCLAAVFFALSRLFGLKLIIGQATLLTFFNVWLTMMFYALFVHVILSWIPHPRARYVDYYFQSFLSCILEPVRQYLPRMGMFDFSVLIVFFGLQFISPLVFKLLQHVPF